jgi:putative membrane protein
MEYYLWIKVFHIVSFSSWMAGVFYFPRLLIYHTENKDVEDYVKIVKIQEDKLINIITIPAMWASILSGSVMIYLNDILILTTWMHLKLLFVALLIIYTYSMKYFMNDLKNNTCTKSSKYFRIYNEIPILLMIVIVISVIIKPFS